MSGTTRPTRPAAAARADAVPALRPTGGWRSRWCCRPSPPASGWSRWSGRSSGSAAGPAQLSVVVDRRRGRRPAPGAAGRRGRRPGPAEADPARRRRRRAGRHGAGRRPLAHRPRPSSGTSPRSSFVTGVGHGVLLPGLLRVAARAGARVRPAGGQRLRGHGPPDDRPGASARPSPACVVGAFSPGAPRSRSRRRLAARALVALTTVPLTAGPPRASTPDADRAQAHPVAHRAAPTCARASSTWCARRGCWPRCSSRR